MEATEKINQLMYMDDIKLFSKSKKKMETLIQTVRIYSQDTEIKFCIDKCASPCWCEEFARSKIIIIIKVINT